MHACSCAHSHKHLQMHAHVWHSSIHTRFPFQRRLGTCMHGSTQHAWRHQRGSGRSESQNGCADPRDGTAQAPNLKVPHGMCDCTSVPSGRASPRFAPAAARGRTDLTVGKSTPVFHHGVVRLSSDWFGPKGLRWPQRWLSHCLSLPWLTSSNT